MHSFIDTKGRHWLLQVNIGAVKRVKALCGINILDLLAIDPGAERVKTDVLDRLAEDPVLLVDTLFAVCQPQAIQLNVSDEEFGESLSGDVIEAASLELIQAIVDFFPEAKRKLYQKGLSAVLRFAKAKKEKLLQALETTDFDQVLESQLQMLNDTSLNAQESVE